MLDAAYTGASVSDPSIGSWRPGLQPSDDELRFEREMLTARSRDLDRNNGVAAGIAQTYIDNIVGVQLRLSSIPDHVVLGRDKDWAREWASQVEARWRTYAASKEFDAAGQMDFTQASNMVLRGAVHDGEAVALPMWREDRRTRTCFMFIDPERLGDPFGAQSIGGDDGVERNEFGEPTAYWIRRRHPYAWRVGDQEGFDRVPARFPWGRRRVLHVFDKQRSSQSRGKSWFSAVMKDLKMTEHFSAAHLRKAVINAMIAAFVETPMDADSIAALFGDSDDSTKAYLNARNGHNVKLQGGAVIPLYPGDRLSAFDPKSPSAEYGSYMETLSRYVGVGLNLPYEIALKDFSKTNYSSARAALLEAHRFFNGRRRWLVAEWAQPAYTLWLEEQINRGFIEAPDFYEHIEAYTRARWIGSGRGWVDPVKEAQASKLRRDGLISTLEQECAEQGLDWEEVLEQLSLEKKRIADLGLTEADVAAAVAALSDAPSDDGPDDDPDEEPEEDDE